MKKPPTLDEMGLPDLLEENLMRGGLFFNEPSESLVLVLQSRGFYSPVDLRVFVRKATAAAYREVIPRSTE